MVNGMVDKIIFATGNEHKMAEIRMILEEPGVQIISQREAQIEADVVEDGTTFEENALIKATEVAKAARKIPGYERSLEFIRRAIWGRTPRMILRIRP